MTADEGIALAAYQRPGSRIIVGPTDARDEFGVAADDLPLWVRNSLGVKAAHTYPVWHQSFEARDLYLRLGWFPSSWAFVRGRAFEYAADRDMLTSEWEWLAAASTGLKDVMKWVDEAWKARQSNPLA